MEQMFADPVPTDLDWPRLLAVAKRKRVTVWRAGPDGCLEPVTEPPEVAS